MPSSLCCEEAAALPVAGCTAMFAVRDFGGLRPGQQVLINGAGGGIGVHALQLAKHAGAIVTAVCSGEKAAMARELGADRVIDYRREDFTKQDVRYDVIIDLASSRSLKHCRRVLAPDGRFVWVGSVDFSPLFGPLRPALGVMLTRKHEVAGFALFLRFGRGYTVGPTVARDLAGAKVLISHWLGANAGMFCRVDVRADSGLSPWLDELGLQRVGRVTRMVKGKPLPQDSELHSFSLVTQALG